MRRRMKWRELLIVNWKVPICDIIKTAIQWARASIVDYIGRDSCPWHAWQLSLDQRWIVSACDACAVTYWSGAIVEWQRVSVAFRWGIVSYDALVCPWGAMTNGNASLSEATNCNRSSANRTATVTIYPLSVNYWSKHSRNAARTHGCLSTHVTGHGIQGEYLQENERIAMKDTIIVMVNVSAG